MERRADGVYIHKLGCNLVFIVATNRRIDGVGVPETRPLNTRR